MKLAIDPFNSKYTDVDNLVDDLLVSDILNVLNLNPNIHSLLKTTLEKLYHDFLDSYYDVHNSLPEHEEAEALMKVHDAASLLYRSIMDLCEYGNTDQRFANALKKIDNDKFLPEEGRGIFLKLVNDWNPNIYVRQLVIKMQMAAEEAADLPNKKPSAAELKLKLKQESDLDLKEQIKTEIAIAEWMEAINPDCDQERKKRVLSRKVRKDSPIRRSVRSFKEFLEEHTEVHFSAGKYYPEIGFKSPAFYAVRLTLRRIYPNVSDRKIASIMQEINAQ